MGLLAMIFMLATPSYAQKTASVTTKAKKTTAFEQATMRAEFYKKHPAFMKAPKMLKKDKSGLSKTVVGRLWARQNADMLKAADGSTLIGTLLYEGSEQYNTGLYSFQSSASPVLEAMIEDPNLGANGGGVVIGTKMYFASYEDIWGILYFWYHYVLDLTTGEYEVQAEDADFSNIASGSCVAYDESTKLAYGLFLNAEGSEIQFCSMDYTTWTKTVIGSGVLQHASDYLNFSCDGKGNLYGVTASGEVYKIDVNTLEETLFTSTGVVAYPYIQGATINPKTNTLYWTFIQENETSGIVQVNLADGSSEVAGLFPYTTEIGLLFPPVSEAEDGAPDRAVNLKAYVENDAPNDVNVSFSLPTMTYDGLNALTGMLEYTIYVNGEIAVKGSGQPGVAIITRIPDVPSGKTVISVVVTNAVGNGPTAKTQLWAGLDAPQSPAPATLTIDEAGKATVTWTAVTLEGAHGGYVNTENVTYTVVRYPDNVVVAEGINATTLEETIDVSNLKMVTYGITAYNGEVGSEEAVTNAVKVGSSYGTPAGEVFDENSTLDLYTIIDSNEDGYTWILNSGIPSCRYNGSAEADDWLLTAPIKLQAGKLYTFKCQAGPYSSYYPERMEVLLGQGDEPTGYATQLVDPTDLLEVTDFTKNFTVEADGEYRIGFHGISDADMFYLQLLSWSVSAPIDFAAPGEPTDAALVPGEKGALTGTVQFNAPTKTVGGDDLTGTMSIKVAGGEDFETTISDVTPGQAISVPVEFSTDSIYSFEITPSNDKGVGLSKVVSAFIGKDIPAGLENIKGYDNFNGSATFTWDKISEKGEYGGYVDPEEVTYRIYGVEDGYLGDVLAETKDLSYVLTSDAIDNGDMSLVQVGVCAFIGETEGAIYAGALVGGTPSIIPYAESFPNGGLNNYWWTSTEEGESWALSTDAADEDGGCAIYEAVGKSDAYISSGKISVKGAANPKLLFQWAAIPQENLKIRVLGDRQDGNEPVELKVIDCSQVTAIEWAQEVIDLSAFTSDPYVIISFEALSEETGGIFEFDAMRIYDVYSNDLAVECSLPKAVNVGAEMTANVIVKNIGETTVPAGGYTVKLYVNGEEVNSVDSSTDLAAYYGEAGYTLSYTTTLFDESPAAVKAEVVYNYDLDLENNVAEGAVNIRQSNLARVSDLTAETGGWPAVELKWSAPVVPDVQGEVITEDFEDQEIFVPLSVGGITADNHYGSFGNWTLYDGNGLATYTFNGAPAYENANAPMAYIVWNPTVVGYDLTDPSVVQSMGPNSGEQFLLSFCCADESGYPPSDKWLISPLLTGEAQTISFFVSEITDQYGPELYEVWYSTTDNEVGSFQKIYDGSVPSPDWTEVTIELPEGAKYFAIRAISEDVFGFELDDITFTAAASKKLSLATEITGYNIYRDGKLIATVGADVNSYVDVNETDGEHTYHVTVLYGDQESGLSNGATVVTAISELTSDASLQDADITVYATNGAVVASGKGVYNGLAKGVYVIRNNETGLVKGVSKK